MSWTAARVVAAARVAAMMGAAVLAGVGLVWSAAAGMEVAAEAEKPAELPLKDAVEQHGITWKFDKKAPVGQFVTGDYYVVGPVTVVEITPKPEYGENGRNGCALNLPIADKAGFDSRLPQGRYDASLGTRLPVAMKPGDALLSTISVEKMGGPRWDRPSDKTQSPVKTAAVLTCLEKAAPADAFRPGYCDPSRTIYLSRSLRRDLLPKLARVASMESPEKWSRAYGRPWIDTLFDGFASPTDYQPQYGREAARAAGITALLLCCDIKAEEKEKLLISFVQTGIDLWGMVRAGHGGWAAHGGHGNGRKLPIVFAGMMLGDADMQNPYAKYPKLKLSEDMQTMYGEGWTGAKAVYAGHVGKDGLKGKKGWGAYEHLPPSQWADPPELIGESYRRCCTSVAWVGEALALRILRAEKVWNHDAFFDYVDRWMSEDDTEHVKAIKEATGRDYSASWARQGQAWDKFVEEMWAKYRKAVPAAKE